MLKILDEYKKGVDFIIEWPHAIGERVELWPQDWNGEAYIFKTAVKYSGRLEEVEFYPVYKKIKNNTLHDCYDIIGFTNNPN